MKERRYFLCLIVAGILLYYALPHLPIYDGKLGFIFTVSWLTLCLFVIAGNLAALLFATEKQKKKQEVIKVNKKRVRSYQ